MSPAVSLSSRFLISVKAVEYVAMMPITVEALRRNAGCSEES